MNENKSLEDYLVKPGEQSPFANLLVDLAFKKAFDPDKPTSRENLGPSRMCGPATWRRT